MFVYSACLVVAHAGASVAVTRTLTCTRNSQHTMACNGPHTRSGDTSAHPRRRTHPHIRAHPVWQVIDRVVGAARAANTATGTDTHTHT